MARVLFVNGGSEGHINPTIGVVQELISRGEEVVYVCIEAFRERIEKTGATVRTFDGQQFIQAFISGGRDFALQRINGLLLTADIVLPSVLEQIPPYCEHALYTEDGYYQVGINFAHDKDERGVTGLMNGYVLSL